MRRRILLALGAACVLLAAGLAAAWLVVVSPSRPGGSLETDLADVTVVRTKKRPQPERRPVVAADTPCWNEFGGDPQRSLARPEIRLGAPTKALWARAMGSYMEYPPAYCNGVLYVNTYAGKTAAVDAATGKIRWSRTGGSKPSSPAIAGSLVVVTSRDGTVTAFDLERGRRVWQLRMRARVESSPAAVGNSVYFGSQDGRLFALDARDGRIRWAYDTGGRINSSPSVFGRRICITTYSGAIFCLDRRNGRKLWSRYFKRDFFRYESFYASASTDGRRLFTVARSGKVYAVRAADGQVLWTARIHSLGYSTPAVANGRVFLGDFNGYLHAYAAATGRELWRRWVGGRILGAPVVVGNLVFFSTLETTTYAARASNGRVVWRIGIGKYSPGIATGQHYFFSLNGILVAFRGKNSPPDLARSAAGQSPTPRGGG
jgi:outer membrane protein assembly factor BamB